MLDAITSAIGSQVTLKPSQQSAARQPAVVEFAASLLDVVRDAEKTAVGGIQGTMPMQDVVMKVMEAERTFATAMAIRDKAVGAYLEISRMQI
jgi:flagellar hook-basal body complex protein FliE